MLVALPLVIALVHYNRDNTPMGRFERIVLSIDWIEFDAPLEEEKLVDARRALDKAGTNAIPILLQWIREDRHSVWEYLAGRRPFRDFEFVRSKAYYQNRRGSASVWAFRQMNTSAYSAFPELNNLIFTSKVGLIQNRAIWASVSVLPETERHRWLKQDSNP